MALVSASWNASTAFAGHWVSQRSLGENPNAALCAVLKKHLDAEPCMEVGLQSYPEFSSPPWEPLDPEQHIDLIGRLIKSGSSFNNTGEIRRRAARAFIDQEHGTLQVWRAHWLSNLGDNADVPVPPSEIQTLVRMTYTPGITSDDPACKAKAGRIGRGPNYLVLPDLSGPDPRVGRGIASILTTTEPVIYRNTVLFISTYASYGLERKLLGAQASVFKNYEAGLLGGVCVFEYRPDKGK